MSVVQSVSAQDPMGPGFVIDPEVMRLLAELGAPIDVDLSIESE